MVLPRTCRQQAGKCPLQGNGSGEKEIKTKPYNRDKDESVDDANIYDCPLQGNESREKGKVY